MKKATKKIKKEILKFTYRCEEPHTVTFMGKKFVVKGGGRVKRTEGYGIEPHKCLPLKSWFTIAWYQGGIPDTLVTFLRKHKIKFFGDDFTCYDPLKDDERLEPQNKTTKFARGDYIGGKL